MSDIESQILVGLIVLIGIGAALLMCILMVSMIEECITYWREK